MQIAVLDAMPALSGDIDISAWKKLGIVSAYARSAGALVRQRLRGADIVLVHRTALTREDILFARSLKMIGILGSDYTAVDIAAAAQRGIPVCITPHFATRETAQLTVSLVLELCGRVGRNNEKIRRGAWTASRDYCWWEAAPVSLYGKTAGIIGCGAVGRETGRLLTAFGMRIIGYNPHRYEGFCGEYVSLPELYAGADVILLHCPKTGETAGMIDGQALSAMKPGAFLVNTADGGLVIEQEIAAALSENRLSGYAADTVSTEPLSVHNPLLSAPNCVLSAHCGWASESARQRMVDITAENIRSFMAGTPVNTVF